MNYRFDGPDGILRISYADGGWDLYIYDVYVSSYSSAEDAAADVSSHNTGNPAWDDDSDADYPEALADWGSY